MLEKLAEKISEHCPNSNSHGKDVVLSFAQHLVVCNEHSLLAAKVSADTSGLLEILRASRKLQHLLDALTASTKMELNYSISHLAHSKTNTNVDAQASANLSPRFLEVFQESDSGKLGRLNFQSRLQDILQEGVQTVLKQETYQNKASTRRNYHAAVVVWGCRKIWKEFSTDHSAPKVLNADRHGDFGTFVASIFDVLSIGCSPSAALASLASIQKNGELSLSLIEG